MRNAYVLFDVTAGASPRPTMFPFAMRRCSPASRGEMFVHAGRRGACDRRSLFPYKWAVPITAHRHGNAQTRRGRPPGRPASRGTMLLWRVVEDVDPYDMWVSITHIAMGTHESPAFLSLFELFPAVGGDLYGVEGCKCLVAKGIEVDLCGFGGNLRFIGARLGMAGGEYRTAVLIREY